uniref:Uncharacterized protein n=1 Tax=Eutreptiella gymnastica TaxID=73025 RepID=A0A7S1NL33_9EUGL|mmetsp:Transcript_52700/g.94075  ORF Transcript_52700/g.94075 Transcript_52700/m.94075 type:complete len:261 (+) Transcript_52700:44-826(+)
MSCSQDLFQQIQEIENARRVEEHRLKEEQTRHASTIKERDIARHDLMMLQQEEEDLKRRLQITLSDTPSMDLQQQNLTAQLRTAEVSTKAFGEHVKHQVVSLDEKMLRLRTELEDIKAQWEKAHKLWEADPLVQQLRCLERSLQAGADCTTGAATSESADKAQPSQMECELSDLSGNRFQPANAKAEERKLYLAQECAQLQKCLEEGTEFIAENQEIVAQLQRHVADQKAHVDHQLCPQCLGQHRSQPPQVQAQTHECVE